MSKSARSPPHSYLKRSPAAIKMTQPLFQVGFVRPLVISGLAAILTGCAAPEVHQESLRILHNHHVAKTEKLIVANKPNRQRSTTNRHTVNAALTGLQKVDISSDDQPKNNSDTVRNVILKSL